MREIVGNGTADALSARIVWRRSGSFWNSTKAIVCGLPSSVTMKSSFVRPSMGSPFLSLTDDGFDDELRVATRKVMPVVLSAEYRGSEDECAELAHPLEPQADRCLKAAHGIRCVGRPN